MAELTKRQPAVLNRFLINWQKPPIPEQLKIVVGRKRRLEKIEKVISQRISEEKDIEIKSKLEIIIADWLYDLIRMNIKRGRIFTIERALEEKKADCLAYGQILAALAKKFGLEIGIVEVIVDNGGRYTSHPCNLFKLSDGSWRLVDLWYGSKSINHKRIGAWIKEADIWSLKDINEDEFYKIEEIKGLSEEEISGLTIYTLGNIQWNRKKWDEAIACYTTAISFYPENARFYHNRAGAYQEKGEEEKEKADLEEAFKRDPTGLRLLAKEHQEIEELIKLDELEISERDQSIYLLHKGFQTGQEVGLETVAAEYKISLEEVKEIISKIEEGLNF